MILAHVGGLPVEEMLIPSAAGSGTALLIARTWLSFRLARRREAARREGAGATHDAARGVRTAAPGEAARGGVTAARGRATRAHARRAA